MRAISLADITYDRKTVVGTNRVFEKVFESI